MRCDTFQNRLLKFQADKRFHDDQVFDPCSDHFFIYLGNDLFEVFDHLRDFGFRLFNRFGVAAQIPLSPFLQLPAPEFLDQFTHLTDNFSGKSLLADKVKSSAYRV